MAYDSRPATLDHIKEVRRRLSEVLVELNRRAAAHDHSKLESPEKAIFDEFTPLLGELTYGSPEYREALAEMKEKGLGHHYEVNDHHPEHFEHGIRDMDLVQLLEMLADWKAASERHDDGNLARSIKHNAVRFGYTCQFEDLLTRTADHLGWL